MTVGRTCDASSATVSMLRAKAMVTPAASMV
jgi:hypothetical protein